ncbi:MAG: hypothetical protein HN337_06815 [Deltaproteobacteria bacterium]|jgi:hypothetical protein|nr:hypothetical protein [Deltaproteobacteria bacterium]
MLLLLPHNWDSFIYQFVVGGIIFALGIIIPLARGDVKWSRPGDRITLITILAGVTAFIIFFIAWQIYAIKGG